MERSELDDLIAELDERAGQRAVILNDRLGQIREEPSGKIGLSAASGRAANARR